MTQYEKAKLDEIVTLIASGLNPLETVVWTPRICFRFTAKDMTCYYAQTNRSFDLVLEG